MFHVFGIPKTWKYVVVDEAQVWGRLRVPRPENAIDKQIAATALIHDLTLVTQNTDHFEGLGTRALNPFD